MDLKTTLITGSVVTLLGLTGVLTYVKEPCFQDVSIKTEINEQEAKFCGTPEQYDDLKVEIKKRFNDNSLIVGLDKDGETVSDYVSAVLIARNDETFFKEMSTVLTSKYDTKTKQFDGSKFDKDFLEQLAFYTELANIKCGGECEFTGGNINEQIYNLLK